MGFVAESSFMMAQRKADMLPSVSCHQNQLARVPEDGPRVGRKVVLQKVQIGGLSRKECLD